MNGLRPLLLALLLLAGPLSLAAAAGLPPYPRGRAETRAPGAGANEMCPVMPDQRASEEFQIDLQGKRIDFCCPKCALKFKEHPRPYWVRLPQYSPYLALNWPDPNIDQDRNRVRLNNEYREAADVGRFTGFATIALLIALTIQIVHSRRRRNLSAVPRDS